MLFLVLILVVRGFVVALLDPARLHFVIGRLANVLGVGRVVALGNRGVALLVDRERMRAFFCFGLDGFRSLLGRGLLRFGDLLCRDRGDDDRLGFGGRRGIGARFDRLRFARDRL